MNQISKIITLVFGLLYFPQITQAQITSEQLNGMWQAETLEIGSGYRELYYFYLDGKFSYHPSEYDGLKRIIAIKGTYELAGNELILTTTSTEERVGGNLSRDPFIPTNDSWAIDGGKIIEVELEPVKHHLTIGSCENADYAEPCILIDNRPFYRLD